MPRGIQKQVTLDRAKQGRGVEAILWGSKRRKNRDFLWATFKKFDGNWKDGSQTIKEMEKPSQS